jgi:hypothetical protein
MRRLLTAAAALRAAGASWEAVAARLNRSAATCRCWPCYYRSIWDELYRKAEADYLDEVRAEARCVLRSQLRLEDVKEKRDAAKTLLTHADRNRDRNADRQVESIEAHVEALSDESARTLESATDAILGPESPD